MQEIYFAKLFAEIENSPYLGEVDTVYFGGGTPSAVDILYVENTLKRLMNKFSFHSNMEITIECNPESLTKERLKAYLDMGINRFSLGVQSFSDDTLKKCNRLHNAVIAENAINLLYNYTKNYSIDLILGLDDSEKEIARATLFIKKYEIPHISAYGLKIEQGTEFYRQGISVDEDRSADAYDFLLGELEKLQIFRYEVSNFAKEGYHSRHNMKYWKRENYLGFGASAHSLVDNLRFHNAESVYNYIENNRVTSEVISPCDIEFEYIMLNLRTQDGINLEEFKAKFGYDFLSKIPHLSMYFDITTSTATLKKDKFQVMNSILTKI